MTADALSAASLGLVNAYLKRSVKKGLIKVSGRPRTGDLRFGWMLRARHSQGAFDPRRPFRRSAVGLLAEGL